MRIGIFSVVDHYPKELPRGVGQNYAELLESAVLAEELGFDSFWIAEHHFHEYGAIPSPQSGWARRRCAPGKIRLGSGVSVLPFHNPITVAEEYAMVDIMSGGRLEFGVGSGYLKHEFAGYGVATDEKHARFDEALEVIELAWRGGALFISRPLQSHRRRPTAIAAAPEAAPADLHRDAALRGRARGRHGYPLLTIPYAQSPGMHQLTAMTAEFRERGNRRATAIHRSWWSDARCIPTSPAAPPRSRLTPSRPSIATCGQSLAHATSAVRRPRRKELIACGSPDTVIKVLRDYERAGSTCSSTSWTSAGRIIAR